PTTKTCSTPYSMTDVQISFINAHGYAQRNTRTSSDTFHLSPAWSPAGTKCAFTRLDEWGFAQTYSMNADGTNQVDLSNNSADDYAPAWSPDGTKIAFDSDRTGLGDVFVMNADGSNQTDLTNNAGADDFDASWSPDGTQIAFDSDRDCNFHIFVMNPDGSGQAHRTNGAEDDLDP